jgi:hypothetical protein
MDAKLRELLRRHGVSEEALDKIDGDAPAKSELRKAAEQAAENHPKLRECRDLLAKIQADVAEIKKADAAYPRPILQTNGHTAADTMLSALSKGQ